MRFIGFKNRARRKRDQHFTRSETPLSAFRVSYRVDVMADTPRSAAEQVAEMLSEPGTAARGAYEVVDLGGIDVDQDPLDPLLVDLGEGEW